MNYSIPSCAIGHSEGGINCSKLDISKPQSSQCIKGSLSLQDCCKINPLKTSISVTLGGSHFMSYGELISNGEGINWEKNKILVCIVRA